MHTAQFPGNDMKGFGRFLDWHDVTSKDILCGRDKLTFNHTGKCQLSKDELTAYVTDLFDFRKSSIPIYHRIESRAVQIGSKSNK